MRLVKNEKGRAFVATSDIPAKTVILVEKTKATSFCGAERYHEMFQILYDIFTAKPQKIRDQFISLAPDSIDKYTIAYAILRNDLANIRVSASPDAARVRAFFLAMDPQLLRLYCTKYLRNAFGGRDGPLVLFRGAMFNHSCLPNVTFIPRRDANTDTNTMYFITTRNVLRGEELCDHYVDLEASKAKRQKRLLNQYGFVCKCVRCVDGAGVGRGVVAALAQILNIRSSAGAAIVQKIVDVCENAAL